MRNRADQPKIYDYDDYRLYLAAMCDYLIQSDAKLSSFRKLSVHLGFRSQNFLKMVIDGERNLSTESLKRICQAFSLSRKESEFFESLVNFNQATTVDEKAFYGFEVVRANINPNAEPINRAHMRYLTEIHYITLREMVQIEDFCEDPKEIAKLLLPKWTSSQVEKALSDLVKYKYLKRSKEGKLELAQQVVSTGDVRLWTKVQKAALEKLHEGMAKLAVQSINKVHHSDRDISGVTVNLSRAKMEKAREILAQTRKQLLELEQDEQFETRKDEEIFRVNLQLFPLTNFKKKRGKK